ncbi:hypothetical protein FNO01nite_04480 [Flavobacterium noncentrifugens]|uniref:Outer membrane protein beta-barrel domain-containing protein n=1 Tax=Flavobacterium noncentrifugens TaxID=1128970 RepID=A0A1G8SC85_9FLAO|nr:outer membrane beta-barrel protein [Flavobacterium noncentrifugens]GEP49776.1 hypothetical protein FNO01nite_04480 [Flavobacterium noncentrifugens]SDJ26866.1 Outer membrane protein beta-barrel domain-containing protein [Flavobacterium noncentrifugens]
MKKILIAAFFIAIGISQAQAQVTFKPGIRAGANFSHFTKGDSFNNGFYYEDEYYDENQGGRAEFESKTDFYVGVYGALRLTRYYTLQPEINYSRQGSKFKYIEPVPYYNEYGTNEFPVTRSGQTDVSYLSVAVMNKFTFGEKFSVQIGPTLDFVVDKTDNFGRNYTSYRDIDSDVDLAFVAGIGFNFTKNIGIEARVKKGIIPVLDFSDSSHTNVVFSVGANYTFDIK